MTVELISLPLSCFAFAGASAWASMAALLPEDEQPTIHSMTAAERISLFITFTFFIVKNNMIAGLILVRRQADIIINHDNLNSTARLNLIMF
ncbi:hypothetical protein D3C85_1455290 [compost metagenome]|nr:hypothetical protein BZ163_20065 [Pseudomonas sp. VI4.1]